LIPAHGKGPRPRSRRPRRDIPAVEPAFQTLRNTQGPPHSAQSQRDCPHPQSPTQPAVVLPFLHRAGEGIDEAGTVRRHHQHPIIGAHPAQPTRRRLRPPDRSVSGNSSRNNPPVTGTTLPAATAARRHAPRAPETVFSLRNAQQPHDGPQCGAIHANSSYGFLLYSTAPNCSSSESRLATPPCSPTPHVVNTSRDDTDVASP
jgi:hypothetical protein